MLVAGMNINLPQYWKWSKCQEVIDVRDGTHDTPKYVSSGYPLITSKNLKTSGIDFSNVSYISEADHKEISKRSKVDKGDILLAMIGTIGNPVIVDIEKEFSIKNVALFKLSKSNIYPKYFKYLLDSSIISRQLDFEQRGGTQKFVSLKVLRNLLIPLPPLEEQKRIAKILDKAYEIRRKRKESIRLTDELLRSTFLDMFGDPVINPKGWEVKTLGSQIKELKYGTNSKCSELQKNNNIAVLRIPNIDNEKISWNDLKYTNLDSKKISKLLLKNGDLLFVRSNGNPDYIGRCAIFEEESNRKAVYASYLIRGRLKSICDFHPAFIRDIIAFPTFRSFLIREARTTAGNYNINIQGLSSLKLICPPQDKQEEYLDITTKINRSFLNKQKSLQESENLFNSLLQKAFKGEL